MTPPRALGHAAPRADLDKAQSRKKIHSTITAASGARSSSPRAPSMRTKPFFQPARATGSPLPAEPSRWLPVEEDP